MSEILEGSMKTPFGEYPKKTVALAVGFFAVLGFIVWYRNRDTNNPALAGQSEINPATGYPYGSAEDAAAMAAQGQYQFPSGGGGGGGGGGSASNPDNQQFTNNAQWSQYVISYMNDNDIVDDVGPLSAALGKYLSGQPVDATQVSLIEQAIALAGKPPLAGSSGYPPSINTGTTVPNPPSTPVDPYQQPEYNPAHPYQMSGVLPPGTTLKGLSKLYWGNEKWWNLIYVANLALINSRGGPNGNLAGLNLTIPVNAEYEAGKGK